MVGAEADRIARVLSVVDTREYEEIGDRWVPVPGSGVETPCARCGRIHEVHWIVELEDGSQADIGRTCAKAGTMDVRVVLGAESKAKRLARLRSEVVRLECELAERRAAEAKAAALPLPPVEFGEQRFQNRPGIRTATCGDACVWLLDGIYSEERAKTLEDAWRARRVQEFTDVDSPAYFIESQLETTRKLIRIFEEKLQSRIMLINGGLLR